MAGIDRIESAFNIPAIQAEFDAWRTGLAESKDALLDLYNTTKQFKDTSLTNLTANTVKLNAAINASVQNTGKAKLSFDELSKKISEQVQNVNENISALNKNSAAYDQLIKQAVRNKIANDELSSSATALRKSYESGKVTFEQYENTLADIKEAQQSIKTSNADVTKTLNSLEKQAQSSSGSLDNMRARLNELVQSYDKLNATERESEGGQGLQATIQATNKAVTELEVSTGRSQRKVGDYTGALKVLEEALAEVNVKLSAMTAAGQQNTEGFAKASEEAELLTTLVGQQEKGFSSVTAQIRSTERALQTLRAEGFQASEAFDKLRESTVEASREQKEFQRQQKLLEGEAPAIGALILAAKGLGGAYAIAAGATSLFANGNEKVEKELNKLVAIMTLLQGLNEAYALVQQSGAIVTALRSAEMKGLTLATELYAAATGEAAVATETLEATLIASGIGAVILALAAGIAYLIVKIVELANADEKAIKMQKELAEATEKLNQTIKEQIDLIGKSNNDQITYLKNQLSLMDAAGLNREKEFATKTKIAELDKDQADKAINAASQVAFIEQSNIASLEFQAEKKRQLGDLNEQLKKGEIDIVTFVKRQGEINTRNSDNQITAENALAKKRDYYNTKQQEDAKKLKALQEASIQNVLAGREDPDTLKHKTEAASAQLKLDKETYEQSKDLLEKAEKTANDVEVNKTEIVKFNNDERRKIILETINIEADYIKSKNDFILNDEKSTLDQRLAAIKSNSVQEIRELKAKNQSIQNDPGVSKADKQLSSNRTNEEVNKVSDKSQEQEENTTKDFYQRQRDASLSQAQSLLEDQIKINDSILEKDKSTQAQRLALITDSYNKQRAIVGAQLLKTLDDPKLKALDKVGAPNPERLAAIAKYNSDILALNIGFGNKQEEEQKKEQDRQLKASEAFFDKQKDAITVSHSEQIKALNEKNNGTAFGAFGYDSKKKDIDQKSKEDELRAQIDQDQRLLAATKIGSKERSDAEAKIEADSASLSQTITDKKIEDQNRLKVELIKAAEEGTDVAQAAVDARYTNELNHIEKLIETNEKLKGIEVERINASTRSETEKAAALTILQARTDAQNTALALKERKLKHEQAVADKAFNVAKAIEEGVVATLTAFGENTALGFVVAAIATAQIAKIIATPIPAYKTGTGDHPGGLAKVGDGGVPELIQEPGKAPYWSPATSTIMDLLPHTKVTPPSEIERMLHAGLFVNHVGVMKTQTDDKKELRELKETMIWHAQRMEQALNKQRKVTVVNNRVDTNWGTYIDKSVFK